MILYAGLEGSLRLPNIYNCKGSGTQLPTWVLVLDSSQLSVEGGCRLEDCLDVVSSAYPSHIFA